MEVNGSIGNIIDEIKNNMDSDALIESVLLKSNVPNSLGFYITVTNNNNFKIDEIRDKIGEIDGVRFSINE